MKINVRLFAILRDQAGVAAIPLDLPDGSTVATAERMVLAAHPALGKYVARSAMAVNRAYVKRETVLREGDELALIPPVSGG